MAKENLHEFIGTGKGEKAGQILELFNGYDYEDAEGILLHALFLLKRNAKIELLLFNKLDGQQ